MELKSIFFSQTHTSWSFISSLTQFEVRNIFSKLLKDEADSIAEVCSFNFCSNSLLEAVAKDLLINQEGIAPISAPTIKDNNSIRMPNVK